MGHRVIELGLSPDNPWNIQGHPPEPGSPSLPACFYESVCRLSGFNATIFKPERFFSMKFCIRRLQSRDPVAIHRLPFLRARPGQERTRREDEPARRPSGLGSCADSIQSRFDFIQGTLELGTAPGRFRLACQMGGGAEHFPEGGHQLTVDRLIRHAVGPFPAPVNPGVPSFHSWRVHLRFACIRSSHRLE